MDQGSPFLGGGGPTLFMPLIKTHTLSLVPSASPDSVKSPSSIAPYAATARKPLNLEYAMGAVVSALMRHSGPVTRAMAGAAGADVISTAEPADGSDEEEAPLHGLYDPHGWPYDPESPPAPPIEEPAREATPPSSVLEAHPIAAVTTHVESHFAPVVPATEPSSHIQPSPQGDMAENEALVSNILQNLRYAVSHSSSNSTPALSAPSLPAPSASDSFPPALNEGGAGNGSALVTPPAAQASQENAEQVSAPVHPSEELVADPNPPSAAPITTQAPAESATALAACGIAPQERAHAPHDVATPLKFSPGLRRFIQEVREGLLQTKNASAGTVTGNAESLLNHEVLPGVANTYSPPLQHVPPQAVLLNNDEEMADVPSIGFPLSGQLQLGVAAEHVNHSEPRNEQQDEQNHQALNTQRQERNMEACVTTHHPEAGSRAAPTKPKRARTKKVAQTSTPPQLAAPKAVQAQDHARCCPVEVPSVVLMLLDQTVSLHAGMLEQYLWLADKLCAAHRERFLRITSKMTSASTPSSSSKTPTPAVLATSEPDRPADTTEILAPSKRRSAPAAVSPSVPTPPRKKRRVLATEAGDAPTPKVAPPEAQPVRAADVRPRHNSARDSVYREKMLKELKSRYVEVDDETLETHGGSTNKFIFSLLDLARQPNVDLSKGRIEARLLSGEEAMAMLESGTPDTPIFTQQQQMFKWNPKTRPIAELFRRMEDLDRQVSVQIPSRSRMDDSFECRELSVVRDRFLAREETDDPWNILDLRSPIPAAILPEFLTGENCQLLPRLRDAVLMGKRAERGMGTREQWNEWRDVLEWVLLSEGGHNTSPHTDSHGLATWISVQEGLFGFGWLSHPTEEEREEWMADPQGFTGGRWRYIVLEPGQTVFFNSGTIHFVFRLRGEQTLALGGHVLQWSGIEPWIRVVSAQMNNPHITNEEMEWSAPKYVRVVAELVQKRVKNGRVADMGGEEAVKRVLDVLQDFDDKFMKPPPKKGKAKGKAKGKKKKGH